MFKEPRFSNDELDRLYNTYYDENRRQYEPHWKQYSEKEIKNIGQSRIFRPQMIHEIITSIAKEDKINKILDFGGGDGNNITKFSFAKKYLFDPSATIISEDLIKTSKIEENAPYDLIVCAHVLEHIVNLGEVIKDLTKLLAENGLIYIEVPYEFISAIREKSGIDEHINFFSLTSIHNIAHHFNLYLLYLRKNHYLYGAWYTNALCAVFQKNNNIKNKKKKHLFNIGFEFAYNYMKTRLNF